MPTLGATKSDISLYISETVFRAQIFQILILMGHFARKYTYYIYFCSQGHANISLKPKCQISTFNISIFSSIFAHLWQRNFACLIYLSAAIVPTPSISLVVSNYFFPNKSQSLLLVLLLTKGLLIFLQNSLCFSLHSIFVALQMQKIILSLANNIYVISQGLLILLSKTTHAIPPLRFLQ